MTTEGGNVDYIPAGYTQMTKYKCKSEQSERSMRFADEVLKASGTSYYKKDLG